VDHSRRQFVAQCAAVAGTSAVSAVMGPLHGEAAQAEPLRNWAGNRQYGTTRLTSPTSLADVQAFVRGHARFKVLGTRHCFNGIADSTDEFLSLREMNRVVGLDRAAKTVTIESGMSYGQLCPGLARDGFALHNLASLPHISVAGACATGTHGSGVSNGSLSTAVAAFELVTATGDVVTFARNGDLAKFQAAVVHLGALGVVTKVTLDVQPTYQMRQDVYLDLPMTQVRDHFEDIVAAGYSVSLFTDWQKGRINEVWVKRRLDHGAPAMAASGDFFGARAATTNVHPIVELSAEHCTEQMGVAGPWYERLPHFRMGFTPSSGKELQSEYFVARRNAVEAIGAVERLRDHVSPHLMITELRTIAADDLWMSPCYKRPSLAIHFTWKQDWPAVSKVLPMIERELAPFDVRPHWGKLFTIPSAQLQQRYPMSAPFKQLVSELDPKATFRNAFLTDTLYG
jgi:xylitol oxidase